MDNRVYIVPCPDYSRAGEAVKTLFALMGGAARYAKPGERLLLKVNLLQPAPPEKAVSTHPAVAAAVAELVKGEGAGALIADSPGSGYPYTVPVLQNLYERSGMKAAAQAAGAQLNLDTACREVSFPQGKLMKRFQVMAPLLETDGVLNLCKLKTHVFMGMTGAVKNNFGVIPGLSKVGYHAKLQQKDQFADMLLDLCDFVSPRLSLMDAVTAMEGDGPGAAGTPRQVGLLLASENPLALDVAAAAIIGLEQRDNPLLLAAQRRGLSVDPRELEIVGPSLDSLKIPDYHFPPTNSDMLNLKWWQKPFRGVLKSALSQTPRVRPGLCVGCGVCRDSCPAKAIRLTDTVPRKALVDPQKCIRCYCCHELCPKSAVELHRGILAPGARKTHA